MKGEGRLLLAVVGVILAVGIAVFGAPSGQGAQPSPTVAEIQWEGAVSTASPLVGLSHATYGTLRNTGTAPIEDVTVLLSGPGAVNGIPDGTIGTLAAAWPAVENRGTAPGGATYYAGARVKLQPGTSWAFMLQAPIGQMPAPVRVLDGKGREIQVTQYAPKPQPPLDGTPPYRKLRPFMPCGDRYEAGPYYTTVDEREMDHITEWCVKGHRYEHIGGKWVYATQDPPLEHPHPVFR